jgi:hypothetical protein
MSPSNTPRKDPAKLRSSLAVATLAMLVVAALAVTCLVLLAKLEALR